MTIARCDKVGDHTTDISLLRRIIVGAGMVTRNGHRPGLVPIIKLAQEARGIGDVLGRIEHILQRGKLGAVVHQVDLHATDIDELGPLPSRRGDLGKCFLNGTGEKRLAFDIEGIRAE